MALKTHDRRRRRGRGRGAEDPQTKIWGGGGVLVLKISVARHKIGFANYSGRDLFTNRFTMVALGEILFCRTV